MYPLFHTMLAFSFGNLVMLGWLAAAAVPLLIHLWNRRKHREAPWAAVQFLLAAIRKNARRMQFEQWLLLAVRTLIILLVVLAVAEPYVQPLGVSFTPYRPTHKIFVLDGSYSMAYHQADETLFAQARRMIADIVDASRPGDAFSLILVGEPSRPIVQTPARSPTDFLDELESIQQPHTGGELTTALALAEDAIRRAKDSSTPLSQHEVFILSDLHRASWQPDQQGRGQAELAERLDRLASDAAVLVLDVGQEDAVNAAVTALLLEQPFLTMRSPATLTAVIRNFGQQARPQTLVELEIDGQPIETRRIDLPADGSVTVPFTHTIEDPGQHTATVRLARDFLPIDDVRQLIVEVKDRVRVLLVAGRRDSASYLATALSPKPSDEGVIETKTVSEIALAETELTDYDCIFLANVAQFTSGEERLLRQYLRQGGGLVFFLGDQVMPEVYRGVFGPAGEAVHQSASAPQDGSENGRPSILPAIIGELVRGVDARFNPLEYRHPIVKPFRGRENAGLLSTPVSTYFRLDVPENRPEIEVALALGEGDPAIVTAPVEQGRCVLVATAGSLASTDPETGDPWTAWPAWPSFLPVVREMLNFAVTRSQDRWNRLVGQPIGAEVPIGSPSLLAITLPGGGADTVRVDDADLGRAWWYAETEHSGVYHVRSEGGDQDQWYFAVNVDTSESDLARIDPAGLPSRIAVRSTWQEDVSQPDVGALLGEHRLHRWLLAAAIGLMLMETVLAWRFGRGTR